MTDKDPAATASPAATPDFQSRAIELIKQANEHATLAEQEINDLHTKLASYSNDDELAAREAPALVDKMASVRVGDEPLIYEHQKEAFIRGMQTKEGALNVIGQLISVLQQGQGADKAAGAELGEPSDDKDPFADQSQPEGFASVVSRRNFL